MAIINYTDQLKYAGKGYLDAKMMPVKTVEDLKKISLTQRFEGLTITVLNDGNPQDYWLVGGITNNHWIPKTQAGNYDELRLVLEDGFLKLMMSEEQLGESVDLNNFFPETPSSPDAPAEPYIVSVDYTTNNETGESGIFMCFTYSDDTKKYLNMSQFLSQTYESGTGISISGNIISLDEAVLGRIKSLESSIEVISDELQNKADSSRIDKLQGQISEETEKRTESIANINERINNLSSVLDAEKAQREEEDNIQKTSIEQLRTRVEGLAVSITENTNNINKNTADIITLTERVNAITSTAEGSTPDGETIGITNDDSKALYVKILEKDGNILTKDVNENGEKGLYASIPVFFEDDELL